MNILGSVLICLSLALAVFAITMGAFCNIKAHHPESQDDLKDSVSSMKIYRTMFFIALGILVLGIIFKIV